MQNQRLRATNSSIIDKPSFYLETNKEGSTDIHESLDFQTLKPNHFYREVYDQKNLRKQRHSGDTLFRDPQYQIDLSAQFGQNDHNFMLKRLCTLYGKNKPAFIDIKQQPTRIKHTQGVPHALHELNLYSTEHYRGFFITNDFSTNGRYLLIICIDGKFQTIVVDDIIPISRNTLLPLWGLSYDRPWEIILFKAWAKYKKGFNRIYEARPFEFVQSFSNPTWKYYNLNRAEQKLEFVNYYGNSTRIQNGKIVLRTKSDNHVLNHGLVNNSAGYEIIDILKHQKQHAIVVRSTLKHKWNGNFTYNDENFVSIFNNKSSKVTLNVDRDFIISQTDFNKLFSGAYITARRQTDFFTGSKLIQIPAEERNTHYYQFIITKSGYFDFNFKQFITNAVNDHSYNESIIHPLVLPPNQRFLQNFFVLVKDTQYSLSSTQSNQIAKSHINLNKSNLGATTLLPDRSNFKPVRFAKYQINYSRGYNRGDAKFLAVDQGRYILRFKSQFVNKQALYELGWVSNSVIKPKQCVLTTEEKDQLLHETFTELIHTYPHYYLQKQIHHEIGAQVHSFDTVKYGFAGIKVDNSSTSSVVIQCNPTMLNNQGYALKGKYKNRKENFNVECKAGQYEVIVFKKRFNVTKFSWPPKAIRIFKNNESSGVLQSKTKPL